MLSAVVLSKGDFNLEKPKFPGEGDMKTLDCPTTVSSSVATLDKARLGGSLVATALNGCSTKKSGSRSSETGEEEGASMRL